MPRQPHHRRRDNQALKQTAAGRVLVKAIVDLNDVRNELQRRSAEGDRLAGEKVAVAEYALDRLEAIREAMLEDMASE